MSDGEIQFGKLGYLKYENKDIIVYYKPYKLNDMRQDDITFCKHTKKVILYQGTNYGPSEFRMDYKLSYAIALQCKELGWNLKNEK